MEKRVKLYSSYRKSIINTFYKEKNDYLGKHLSLEKPKDNTLDKKVKILNSYERDRVLVTNYFIKKKITKYALLLLLVLVYLFLIIYFGITLF